ncbi:MAG: hypothetical protein JXR58_05420 [Bacteroidales bacterium]|nr:hypothetical protein [Bacteroidales bacterium]
MKVSDIAKNKIDRLPLGYVFTYDDFDIDVNNMDALMKTLSRLASEGKIRRLSIGRYYKPEISEFGELKPDVYQIVKDLLEKDGKIIGYLTGYSIYNKLGLTTQVANVIQIGTGDVKKNMRRGIYKIRFIKQKNKITKENIPLLRILDSIRNIKEIPDSNINNSCIVISDIIQKFSDSDLKQLIRLAQNYNPATRALLGAIIELKFGSEVSEELYKSLNPASEYDLNISESILPNKQKWQII